MKDPISQFLLSSPSTFTMNPLFITIGPLTFTTITRVRALWPQLHLSALLGSDTAWY